MISFFMDRAQSSFKIILKEHETPLPFQFLKMNIINKDILQTLILDEKHQYICKSDVHIEILKEFIKYLVDDEAPNINIHNFNDFSLLSHEFDVPIVKSNLVCYPFGIIKKLMIQTNGNIEKEIKVTSSSIHSKGREPEKGISIDDASQSFCSQNVKDSWLCVEFINHEISITHYYIRAYQGGPNTGNPKSFVIEGSKDNKNWNLIDDQKKCEFLNGYEFSHIFQVPNPQNIFFSSLFE